MNILDEFSNDKWLEFQMLKDLVKSEMKKDQLTEKKLLLFLNQAFIFGRYVGHCQGEKHRKELLREV
jgi:hypothetical protein